MINLRKMFLIFHFFLFYYPISNAETLGILDISDSKLKNQFDEIATFDCASQRQKSLNRKNSGDSKIYVPACSSRNPIKYESVQCYDISSYCWCVDELSGEPKIGTSTFGITPKCETSTLAVNPKKKRKNRCKTHRRTRFLRRLISTIKAEMIISGVNTTKVSRDSALRWKFAQLNTNKNSYIEKREWKPYKSMLLEWKNSRHCSRNLFKTCDTNRDRKLTFDEWKQCILQEVNMVPAKRPDQLNPFLYILRPE